MTKRIGKGIRLGLLVLLGLFSVPGLAETGKKITTLRVCSDPGNMPLSSLEEEGFQNKIARVLADSLGLKLSYFWRPTIERGLTRKTFGEGKCDVMIGVPANMPRMLTTQPFYRTTYVLVHRSDKDYDIKSLDDPILKEAMIGVFQRSAAREALRRHGIKKNTIVHAMSWDADIEKEKQPHQQVEKVTTGELDMAAVWGAFAGYHKVKLNEPLTLVPMNVLEDSVYLQFDMAVGVVRTKPALVKMLNEALVKEKEKIQAILEEYGVPLVECDSCLISGNLPEHGPYGDITTPVKPGPGDGAVSLADVDRWLEQGADINQELQNAIIADDLPRVEYLIKKGADINQKDKLGYTPLVKALRNGHRRILKLLIEHGADIEETDPNGWPPLHLAILDRDLEATGLLLKAGARRDSMNREGVSAIHVAAEYGSPPILKKLIDSGFEVDQRNEAGYTPLMIAVAKHVEENVNLLLTKGADVNATNKAGVTPLMIAVAGKSPSLITILLDAGAKVDSKTDDGQTALSIARKTGLDEIIQLIEKAERS